MDRRSENTGGLTTEASIHAATRPRFRERQILRASDLEAEQSYLIAARRRHNIGHHGWGIVRGLELVATPDGLAVQPGVAVDGYGRELIVQDPVAIPPPNAFKELESDVLDVWLYYDVVGLSVPQRGSWDCGPGQNNNVREVSRVLLTAAIAIAARNREPRSPMEVLSADQTFLPHQISPDDAAREWPVYLGTIRQEAGRVSYEAETSHRYATLTGEVVVAPSAGARMQVGSELETDSRRFAVSVADADGKFVERLAVDRNGNTIVTGNTTLQKRIETRQGEPDKEITRNITLVENDAPGTSPKIIEPLCVDKIERAGAGKTPGAARMVHFQPLASTPAVPFPWRIYRTSIKRGERAIRQLRIEMQHPGDKGDPALSRVVFGTRDALGAFQARLTVSSDCNVTINADVDVAGELSEGPILADVSDPRFSALVSEQWNEGTVIGQVAAAPGTIRVTVRNPGNELVPGATVTVANLARSVTRIGVTSQAGEFLVSSLAAGNHTVQVVASGFPPLSREDVEVTAGQTVDLPLSLPARPGRIEGILRNPSNTPLSNAPVSIAPVVTSGISEAVTVLTVDGGLFVFRDVPTGRYGLGVNLSGFDPFSTTVDVGDAQTVTRDITLTGSAVTTGTITGTVTDNTGAIVVGATVDLFNLSTGLSRSVATNDEGAFMFPSVAPGNYELRISAPGFSPRTVTVSPGEIVPIILMPAIT